VQLTKEFRFEASHILPRHPGKCSRLHGHSWVLRVSVSGPVSPDTGFVQDFADISSIVKPLIDALDHRHLGTYDVECNLLKRWMPESLYYPINIYPTSENLLDWIAHYFSSFTNEFRTDRVLNKWSQLELLETCTSSAILTREEFMRGL